MADPAVRDPGAATELTAGEVQPTRRSMPLPELLSRVRTALTIGVWLQSPGSWASLSGTCRCACATDAWVILFFKAYRSIH